MAITKDLVQSLINAAENILDEEQEQNMSLNSISFEIADYGYEVVIRRSRLE